MALHRDIYWVGKQWAVTGYGVQACDQKQKSQFDIEASRLWEDDVLESLRVHKWLNVEDLDKALSIARQRFPEPPRKIAPLAPEAIAPIEPLPQVVKPEVPKPARLDPVEPPPSTPIALHAITEPDPEPPKPVAPKFHMLFSGAARFIRPWRIRIRK
jgi:hypothetical protein